MQKLDQKRNLYLFGNVCESFSISILKKRPWHRCFPVNLVKFLRTPFYIHHLRWLLLQINASYHKQTIYTSTHSSNRLIVIFYIVHFILLYFYEFTISLLCNIPRYHHYATLCNTPRYQHYLNLHEPFHNS